MRVCVCVCVCVCGAQRRQRRWQTLGRGELKLGRWGRGDFWLIVAEGFEGAARLGPRHARETMPVDSSSEGKRTCAPGRVW
eukprot:400556-Pleurochrysis_carterae.AAC.2